MEQPRPTLILHPLHHTTADIVKRFTLGKPLTPDQINFLDWHQAQLSNPEFDPVLKYYLKSRNDHENHFHTSFLLPHEKMNREAIALLKKRLAIMLKANSEHRVVMSLTHEQFVEFKKYTIQELIFWHGNQFLTGAPFYPSGTPPLVLFQWGNYFGIIKYVVIAGEKAVMGNLLLYFEDRQERSLEECVADYQKRMANEMKLQADLLHNKEIIKSHDPQFIKTPELTLSKSYLISHLPTPTP
ncbi:MAG: hypothetical protein K0R24_322 [Gammaproteobacteria bacterium]|jgi:hypothetical protein|nr:hypothetical protein [Gammaproteobacteria bacterium]